MADRRRSRARIVLAAAVVAVFAACKNDPCEGGTCTQESPTRLIDVVCNQSSTKPACEATGDTHFTSGVSDDTIGVHIGHGSGALTIHLAAVDAAAFGSGTFEIEVLAAAVDQSTSTLTSNLTFGSCSTGCPPDPPPIISQLVTDYMWVTVVRPQTSAPAATTLPDDARLDLGGRNIDIADIRTVSRFPDTTCSIAGPIGAPRTTR